MKVLKFGGSSVGSAQGLRQVRRIVAANNGQIVVVVSALGGITDRLLATAAAAAAGKPDYTDSLAEIMARHRTTIDETVASGLRGAIRRRTDELLDELANILRGVYLIRDLSPRTGDAIVSYGERLSSGIVAAVLEGSRLYDAREFIRTKTDFGKHIAEPDLTEKLIRERLADRPRVSVVPGFIASDCATGDVTNLGRGGSDYTAALIAAALNAETLEIWTDVDGFMTADPRVISDAYVIDRLSFEEAMELCNFGAKVVYPPTIFPVYHRDIPILIKNTFNPEAPGTFISRERVQGRDKAIKGISSINNTCLVTIQGLGMVGVIGVNHRIFRTLARAGISVFFVSQAASENTTSIGLRNEDADLAIAMLTRQVLLLYRQWQKGLGGVASFQELSTWLLAVVENVVGSITAEHDLATIAVVGDDMKHTPGIAGKLFGTLGRNGINVIACTQGASETNISVVVTLESLPKAINVIHDSFFLSEYQVLNIFVAGVGQVGRDLLEQIRLQRRTLMADNGLQIRVVGIANSRKRLIDAEGIALNDCLRRLEEEGTPSTPESLRDEILALNIYNSVFVDCTASAEVAALYRSLLDHNVSVVASNKIAASSDYALYRELKTVSRKRNAKFLFETNVGAGLPIINTISDLINSGDRILRIEAVVSGTLNYIFDRMSAEIPFSRAVRMAQEAGYAEPDPRVDLSGTDVIRKLVILTREAGYAVEQRDVERRTFLPESCFEGSIDEFWHRLPETDARFETRRRRLETEGKRLRFIARMEDGRTSVGLEEVDNESPFYHLSGSNNVILITTERYRKYPIQIKGYGAGAEVTAAGVFADIIRIANIR